MRWRPNDPEANGGGRLVEWGSIVAVITYTGLRIDRSWIPHDDGMLGQIADRVRRGELPHRDFQEVYTGLLGYMHAAALSLGGGDLLSLRVLLLVAFVVWLLVVRWIARRFLPLGAAGGITAVAGILAVAQWPTPLPSWYNLFLATGAAACMIRFGGGGRRGWVFAAGLLTGLSILIKIVGLYVLAALLLAIALNAGEAARRGAPPLVNERQGRHFGSAVLVGTASLGLVAFILALIRTQLSASTVALYLLPTVALGSVLTLRSRYWPFGAFLSGMARSTAALALGTSIPIALFLVPYVQAGAVPELLHGVFVAPRARFDFAAQPPAPLGTLVLGALSGLPLLAAGSMGHRGRWAVGIFYGVLVVAVIQLGSAGLLARGALQSLRAWVPLLVVWSAARVLFTADSRRSAQAEPGHPEALFTLAAVAALWSLVQFPFAAEFYVFYGAPLTVLLMGALARRAGPALVVVAVIVTSYAVVNSAHTLADATARMEGVHASLRVPPADARAYQDLVAAVDRAGIGPYIFATPDAPEVPFLTGRRNPTGVMYDFFDAEPDRVRRVVAALDRHEVGGVVLKPRGHFSGPVPPELEQALRRRYPVAEVVGPFVLLRSATGPQDSQTTAGDTTLVPEAPGPGVDGGDPTSGVR